VRGYFDGAGRFAEPWLLVLTSLAEQVKTMQQIVQVARLRTATAWGA
jgi:hypothetical protein